jgi:hypothetical protein
MFEPTSRYYNLKDLEYIPSPKNHGSTKGSIIIRYKERRFIPQVSQVDVVQELRVMAGQRLDNIAYHTLGDPEQFWRICDSNEIMHPLDTTSEPGMRLRIGVQKLE